MSELKKVTALLIDANGFEKTIEIPCVGLAVQPSIVIDDRRALSRAMLRRLDADTLPTNPHKQYRLEFRYTEKWAVVGEETRPIFEEVV